MTISHFERIALKPSRDFLPKWNVRFVVPRPNIFHIEWVTVASRPTNVGVFMLPVVFFLTFSRATNLFLPCLITADT